MYAFDKALAWISFCLVSICILVGPWIFGAWEAWHFWPFATLIFISTFAFSLRLFLKAYRAELFGRCSAWRNSPRAAKLIRAGFLSYSIFLAYAFARAMTSEVYADAERNFLVLLTPFLIGAQVVFSFSSKQNRSLFWAISANLILLGIYGIVNHLVFKNAYTMWLPGEPQYQVGCLRATGSYVCPNHFAGIMELLAGIGLALILTHQIKRTAKALGLVMLTLAMIAILLSKSRGGGLTVLPMLTLCMTFCLFTYPKKIRMKIRLAAGIMILAGITVLLIYGRAYTQRFDEYFNYSAVKGKPLSEMKTDIMMRARGSARGIMYSAAYRAWKTAPVFGIGAGMHQNLWPHFAASPDGNRDNADWPSQINDSWYSYEVHNDWLQLLEEYGAIGLLLFLAPFSCLILALLSIREKLSDEEPPPAYQSALLSAAILALTAMSFHSLGDFNLQMPATSWMLAVLLCLPAHSAVSPDKENRG